MAKPRKKLFSSRKALIGMIHVAALPGTPQHRVPLSKAIGQAVDEAAILLDLGFDGLIIENMHDAPYLRREVGPEITAGMTAVATVVRGRFPKAVLGVQVLAGANRAALAVALASGCNFIRAEGFVFASVADEGFLEEADAGPLLRYRRAIGAEHIAIFADIKKKHASHAITADIDIADTARAAAFCSADGVIVTGTATGEPVDIEELRVVRSAVPKLPVLVGSGVTAESVPALLQHADALIVGSALKRNGDWRNMVDRQRAKAIASAFRRAI